MIEAENLIYTRLEAAIRTAHPDCSVVGIPAEAILESPCVMAYMDDCTTADNMTFSQVENASQISFTVDIYSNQQIGAKAECKAIAETVDTCLQGIGFRRIMYTPTPNIDRAMYRLTLRYRAYLVKRGTGTNMTYSLIPR